MGNEIKRGAGAAEELAGGIKKNAGQVIDDEDMEREGHEEEGAGRVKKEAAEVAGRVKEKVAEAAGSVKKAVQSFIHDDKKFPKGPNRDYREGKGEPDPKVDK